MSCKVHVLTCPVRCMSCKVHVLTHLSGNQRSFEAVIVGCKYTLVESTQTGLIVCLLSAVYVDEYMYCQSLSHFFTLVRCGNLWTCCTVQCESTNLNISLIGLTFEIVYFVFFTLVKSRSSELQNDICIFEEQWESNSDLKVDKLVNSLLRKGPLNVLVPTGELSFVYTHSALFTHS